MSYHRIVTYIEKNSIIYKNSIFVLFVLPMLLPWLELIVPSGHSYRTIPEDRLECELDTLPKPVTRGKEKLRMQASFSGFL